MIGDHGAPHVKIPVTNISAQLLITLLLPNLANDLVTAPYPSKGTGDCSSTLPLDCLPK